MSNLYKPWFVHTESQNARVINSNDHMQEFLKQNIIKEAQPKEARPVGPDGFAEGIITEKTDNVIPVEEPEQDMSAANEKAEQILSQARTQADVLIDDARQEAETIREKAKKQGYLEGQSTLEQEYDQKKQQLEQEQQRKKAQLQNSYQEKQKNMERELVDVILDVFNKVFHVQFDGKKEILLHLIDNAIANIEDEKRFRIKVAGDNVSFLEEHKENILDYVGHDIELEIVPDYTLDENACIIETDSGIFDCSLDVQLDNLMKDIRSLCS